MVEIRFLNPFILVNIAKCLQQKPKVCFVASSTKIAHFSDEKGFGCRVVCNFQRAKGYDKGIKNNNKRTA